MNEAVRAFQPEWGLVLGSGLGCLSDAVERHGSAAFADLEEMPVSQVPGHAGRFLWGMLGGVRVLVQQGRVHLYEGHRAWAVTAGVRWMAQAGVRRLVLTNAAGSLAPSHPPGDWMMLTDHLNLTGTSPLLGGPNFIDMTEAYSPRLRQHFAAEAAALGMPLHEGVYAGLMGPQYETPAEVRMLARLGADAVGMSTVLETIQARALGMEVAAFSCLTNWAAGVGTSPLAHQEVLEVGRTAASTMARLLTASLRGA